MATRFHLPFAQWADGNGTPYAGGKLFFFASGTSTPKSTYADADLIAANTNPMMADSQGRFGDIFLASGAYKVILKTSADVTVWTADPVTRPGTLDSVVEDTTPQLGGDLDANGSLILEGRGTAIASAATVDLAAATGNFVHIMGTTTITALGTVAAGAEFALAFDGALQLTHNATSLILPGGANIATAAGDVAVVRSEGGGNWRCVNYVRATALPMLQGKHSVWIPAAAMTARTTNGAAAGTTELATNDVMLKTLDYDQTTEEGAQFALLVPKGVNETTLTALAIWTAASGTGGVAWDFEILAVGNDDAMDAAFGTAVTVTDTLIAANDEHRTDESAAITPSGPWAEGDLLFIQVTRQVGHVSDTLNADAKLIGVMLFVTYNAGNDA